MGKTLAFIMAGGRGKRMDLLCDVRPKPALPFAGRFRVIDFTLSNCVYSGINDLAILTDYQRSDMAKYLREWALVNAVGNFDVLEPNAGSYKGTADSIYQNLSYLDEFAEENVLILAGDHIYRMDYRRMVAFHQEKRADVTVGVIKVPVEDAHRFGTVVTGDDREILEFVEKSPSPRSNLASMGIYVFNKNVLARRLSEDAVQPESPHDFGYTILPGMVGRDRVYAYEFSGYWQDIGTPQAYYAANMELVSAQPVFSINGTRTVLTQSLSLPPANVCRQGKVLNSLISPGCVIKGHVENSILSPGVWVDEQAEVINSVLMANVSVGYHSIVDSCIIDEGVKIGRLCYIGFGKSVRLGNHDITVLGKSAVVPSHTAIGYNCTVIDASSFAGNMIAPGSILLPRVTAPNTNEKAVQDERESVRVA